MLFVFTLNNFHKVPFYITMSIVQFRQEKDRGICLKSIFSGIYLILIKY